MKFSLGKEIDATKGSLTKNLWKMSWPLIVINLIQVIYNLTDTFWVGQLEDSANAIAAVSTSFSIVFVVVFFCHRPERCNYCTCCYVLRSKRPEKP